MAKSLTFRVLARSALLATAVGLTASVSGCAGLGNVSKTYTEGYSIPDDALAQIRPGQSKALVVAVLGSPQTQNTFPNESAYYYVETKVNETAFGMRTVESRRVLAVYFDKNDKVKDKAIYTLKDGKVFALETRRTPDYGQDRTFVQQILGSVGL